MKKLIICSLLVLVAGCATTARQPVQQTKVVTIDKPIPFCPAPIDVAACSNYVDNLTDADLKDPGKVVQAYKLDMTCLRITDKILRRILAGYKDTSAMNKDVTRLFNEYGSQYEKALSTVVPLTEPPLTEPTKTPPNP
jgi:hypothetical protein